MLKIELGGGKTPRGDGFVNVDILPCADVRLDLDRDPLPWDDGTVDEVYSAHCFEHLAGHKHVLREVVRVCRVGARVEFRFPHWIHPMAMCLGHTHVISDRQVKIWDSQPETWFAGCPRRLKLSSSPCYVPDIELAEIRDRFPGWGDELILRFIPGTCHEVRCFFEVIPNEPAT